MEAALFAGRSVGRSVGRWVYTDIAIVAALARALQSSFAHAFLSSEILVLFWFCFPGPSFFIIICSFFLTAVEDCSIFLACFGRVLGSYSSALLQVLPP